MFQYRKLTEYYFVQLYYKEMETPKLGFTILYCTVFGGIRIIYFEEKVTMKK
jgi:hypothetical protein